MPIIGREHELKLFDELLSAGQHVLIEGPVGVGKTFMVTQRLKTLGRPYVRVDGDSRYSEQKLTGWFDPPLVMQEGYRPEHFLPGPLAEAMLHGKVLLLNELNRMPEGVQNILLPALDEGLIVVPKYGEIQAREGFQVVATQNPSEYVATHRLSEAILDRFENLTMGYQPLDEERRILESQLRKPAAAENVQYVLDLIQATRQDGAFQRGASVRAGLAFIRLLDEKRVSELNQPELATYTLAALKNRVQLVEASEATIEDWVARFVKKNSTSSSLTA
jgi:MoxR-like ATPase